MSLVVACLLFASLAAAVKAARLGLSNETIVFFRNFFGLVTVLPLVLRTGATVRTARFSIHVLRVGFGLSAMYCFFFALGELPLGEAVLLNYSSPLFIPWIAFFWLGERLPPRAAAAAVVGFAGILLILKPTGAIVSPAALIGVAAGFFAGMAFVTVRKLGSTEPAHRTVFWFALLATLASAGPAAAGWRTPTAAELALLFAMGASGTAGQLFLTRAYALEAPARIGPFTYTTVVFAALIGWIFWGEIPDWRTAAGAVLVAAGGIAAIRAKVREE